MAEPLKLGFIGAGYMGQLAHLANYARLGECRVVALAEGRQRLGETVARRYGIPRVYPNHRELLAAEDVDAVVCIMGYSLHHAVVPDILAACKHVITEKPICVRPETAHKLADLGRQAGVVYQVGYMKRSDPASVRGLELVNGLKQSGECGALKYVRVTMPPGVWNHNASGHVTTDETPPAYEGEAPEAMPEDLSKKGAELYNAFINYYIHQVNMLRYLLGEDYRVCGVDPRGVTFTAVSDGGVTCLLEMAPYQCADHWEETYLVCFERGWVRMELPAPMHANAGRVFAYRGKGKGECSVREEHVGCLWSMDMQARNFLAAVRGERAPIATADDAAKDLDTAMEYVRVYAQAAAL